MNKSYQELNKSRKLTFLFDKSLIVTSLVLGLGLLLDWRFGATCFQRSGAFVVGFAILTSFELSQIQQTISANTSFTSVPVFLRFGYLVELEPDPKKDSAAINQISTWLASRQNMQPNVQLNTATRIFDTMRTVKKKTPTLTIAAENLRNKEMVIGILGTIVWALGDWIANFLFHCQQAQCPA